MFQWIQLFNVELKVAKNMFIANSKPILNFEKMNENNKKDGDIFQLDKLELNK